MVQLVNVNTTVEHKRCRSAGGHVDHIQRWHRWTGDLWRLVPVADAVNTQVMSNIGPGLTSTIRLLSYQQIDHTNYWRWLNTNYQGLDGVPVLAINQLFVVDASCYHPTLMIDGCPQLHHTGVDDIFPTTLLEQTSDLKAGTTAGYLEWVTEGGRMVQQWGTPEAKVKDDSGTKVKKKLLGLVFTMATNSEIHRLMTVAPSILRSTPFIRTTQKWSFFEKGHWRTITIRLLEGFLILGHLVILIIDGWFMRRLRGWWCRSTKHCGKEEVIATDIVLVVINHKRISHKHISHKHMSQTQQLLYNLLSYNQRLHTMEFWTIPFLQRWGNQLLVENRIHRSVPWRVIQHEIAINGGQWWLMVDNRR